LVAVLHRVAFASVWIVVWATVLCSSAPGAGNAFTVRNSLEGQTVLPLRLHWLASPTGTESAVSEVDFLIDGRVRWIERSAPYNYGSDENGRNPGFLITTWLTPGKHRFTVQAIDGAGNKASNTVVARVVAAPSPPAALAGSWTRTVSDADLRKAGRDPPPPGGWKLVFDRVGAWHLDPFGSGVVNEYDADARVIHVYAPIQMAPFSDGKGGVTMFGHHGIGGNDCNDAGPFGSYRWSVSGNQLTLTAVRERCGNRRAVWEGTWTRTKT
jgi:hypothetical protein